VRGGRFHAHPPGSKLPGRAFRTKGVLSVASVSRRGLITMPQASKHPFIGGDGTAVAAAGTGRSAGVFDE
jgi:hypothetical protein